MIVVMLLLLSTSSLTFSEDKVGTGVQTEECAKKIVKENPSLSLNEAREQCATKPITFKARPRPNPCPQSGSCDPGVGKTKIEGVIDPSNDIMGRSNALDRTKGLQNINAVETEKTR
jgi:hypothetical protein